MPRRHVDQQPQHFLPGDRFQLLADQFEVPVWDELGRLARVVPCVPDKGVEAVLALPALVNWPQLLKPRYQLRRLALAAILRSTIPSLLTLLSRVVARASTFDGLGSSKRLWRNKQGIRYRYYVPSPLLHGQAERAGSVRRVPAAEIEALVGRAVREHFEDATQTEDRDSSAPMSFESRSRWLPLFYHSAVA